MLTGSPKIKTGGRYTVSVVSFIRDKAREFSADTQWFLFWFGLENNQPVFFVFNDKSDAYNAIMRLGVDLSQYIRANENNIYVDSLNRVISEGEEDGVELGDFIADSEDPFAELENRLFIEDLHNKLEYILNKLSETERQVIRLRYYENLTIPNISAALYCAR